MEVVVVGFEVVVVWEVVLEVAVVEGVEGWLCRW